MMRAHLLGILLVGVPGAAVAQPDCATVEDAFLDATSQRESAEMRAVKQELLREMDPADRWLEAFTMYFYAAQHLSMSSVDSRDPQDAAVLLAAADAMDCWNVPGEVPADLVTQMMAGIASTYPEERRAELADIAREMLQ